MEVAISGVEILCALGGNKEEIFNNLVSGKSGIRQFTIPLALVKREEVSSTTIYADIDAHNEYLFRCAIRALEDAKVNLSDLNNERIGLVIGTSLGGMRIGEVFYQKWIKEKKPGLKLKKLLEYPIYTPVDYLVSKLDIKGPSICISTACSSGQVAVSIAYDLIKNKICDLVIAGGVDTLCEISVGGFSSLKALASTPCAPFSNTTLGLSLGEGAGVLIVEPIKNALQRKGSAYAIICGYGIASDCHHPTAPDPTGGGIARAIREALSVSNIRAEEVDYINAHGTGTPSNDIAETLGVKKVFRENFRNIFMSSIKGGIGHTLGAAGSIECAITALSLYKNRLPPTVNFTSARPGCDMNYIPNQGITKEIKIALSNSFAFGGNNSSIALRAVKKEPVIVQETASVDDEPVVITGIGLTSPLGTDKKEIWSAIIENRSSVQEFEGLFDFHNRRFSKQRCRIDDGMLNSIRLKNRRKMDRLSLISSIAAISALADARIKVTPQNSERIGIIYSTGTGSLETIEKFYRTIVTNGLKNGDAGLFPNTVLNAPVGYITIETGIKGPNTTIGRGRVSFFFSLFLGYLWLKNKRADVVLCGSGDEYSEILHKAFFSLKMAGNNSEGIYLHKKEKKGFILGEGASFFVLEPLSQAKRRGAEIHAEIKNFSVGTGDGRRIISKTITNEAGKIDLAFSTITGGLKRDFEEFDAVKRSFNEHICPIATTSRIFGEAPSTICGFNLFGALMAIKQNLVPLHLIIDKRPETESVINKILLTCNDLKGITGSFLIERYNG